MNRVADHIGGSFLSLGAFGHGTNMAWDRGGREMPNKIDYASEFRDRAKQLRIRAKDSQDENFRKLARKCAADFEKLADEFDREALIESA